MRLTVNGAEWELTTLLLASLLHVLREELGVTSPKAGCQEGGLRRLHRARRRRAAARVSGAARDRGWD